MEEEEAKDAVAVGIELEVGLLTKCEVCEDIVDPLDGSQKEDAVTLANHLISEGDARVGKRL